MDIAEQAEAGLVVEAVRDHELGPGVQGHVEGVGVAKALRVAAEDQLFLVLAELLEDVVRDVRVRELILDDRDPGHERVDRRGALGGEIVGRSGDQLGVAGHDQGVLELAQVLRRHLRGRLDELARLDHLLEFGGA